MIGDTVGPYRIVARLGQGGMGVVYQAIDTRLDRQVALKVLPQLATASPASRRRFLQEARAASALNDPHIVTIHDIFTAADVDFLVMEYVQGRTLQDVSRDGPSSIADAVQWTAAIADAVAVAHAAGIIHRDLKPGNIMLTDRGLIKVLDFGLAKMRAQADAPTEMPLTVGNDAMGTLEYMSPEQARGEPLDHRTDIFSLGAICHELLTGERLFRADHAAAVMHAVLYADIPSATSRRQDVPAGVSRVVGLALKRNREERYASMAAFASGLRAGDVDAGRVSLPAAVVERRREWPRVAALSIAAAVVATMLAVAGLDLWRAPANGAMPAAAPGATVLEHVQRGTALLRRFDLSGNVDDAITAFESAVTVDKAFAPAWAGLARAYWRKQLATRDTAWTARALDAARQGVTLDPLLADAHVSLGLAELGAGNIDAATPAFQRALTLNPKNADAERGLADVAEDQNRLEDASRHYATAMQLDPGNWELPRLAGNIPYTAGRYKEALVLYQRAAEIAPDSADAFRLEGAAHHMLGDYASAASALQKSIAIRPNASAYTNLGTALFFQGLYRESVPAFEKAVEMLPSAPLMWGNLGDAYKYVPGNRDRSLEAYRRAVQLIEKQLAADPKNIVNRSRLALYAAKAGDRDAAQAALAQAITPSVKDASVLYRGAVASELIGDRSRALRLLEAALANGYAMREVVTDPELTALRSDVSYHRLELRFQRQPVVR